jgi:3-deoxy-D-manno-octulosonate 8-phosphate phosphatase (KDO 8-P phosphatase)
MTNPCTPSPPGSYPSDCEITEGYRTMARNRILTANQDAQRLTALAKAAPLRLLLLDVDGVLTDGSIFFSHDGMESKAFNTQDGFGLRLLLEAGIETGVITARTSEAVSRRARDLRMRYVFQGESNKLTAFMEITRQSGLKPFEIAYMGDDWLDLVLLIRVGFAAAPANAVEEVKRVAHYVCRKPGGHGAVREICDFLLEAKGVSQQLLQTYMSR